ncbi:hypothetical protein MBOURGENBZM_16020 [Methanoculleus bourgensis]|nr:hypothetical protein MBOURGENBZM_16020 [Methanoculleus bourgensis]
MACPDRGICWYEPAGCRMGYVRFFSIKKSREGGIRETKRWGAASIPPLMQGVFPLMPPSPREDKKLPLRIGPAPLSAIYLTAGWN